MNDLSRLQKLAKAVKELKLREERERQAQQGGFLDFVRYFWDVLEPETELIEGWPLEAICLHLEAVTWGMITRLLINVPPGFMKSLLLNIFWPAWEWSAAGMPHLRYLSFSYVAENTERDNRKFLDLIQSQKFQELWGHKFKLRKAGEVKVTNDKTGSKLATSVGGVGTGQRGDRVLADDLHNVKDIESDQVIGETTRWFRESMSNRLNNMESSAIIVVGQRVRRDDVSGSIIDSMVQGGTPYCHLMIANEFEPGYAANDIGWEDPRQELGELAWSERFSARVTRGMQLDLGPFAYAAQYQQRPTPRGGAILKTEWWQPWDRQMQVRMGVGAREYPVFSYMLGSVDTAYTEKEENDPSAMTVIGVWTDNLGNTRAMLVACWEERLEFHNLIQRIATTANRWKLDKLLIEAKASGISIGQEIRRLYSRSEWNSKGVEPWGMEVIDPGRQDKVARAHSVVNLFAASMVYAPWVEAPPELAEMGDDGNWAKFADLAITRCEEFPKAARKDVVDTITQALRYLRDNGLLSHPGELKFELDLANTHTGAPSAPLYPG